MVFSAGLETLAGWKMTTEAAKANMVVVAGQGDTTDRMIYEQTDDVSIGTWGRAETFQDPRDTADPEWQGRHRNARRLGHPGHRRVHAAQNRGSDIRPGWAR